MNEPSKLPLVLVGETRSRANIERLKGLGWGRMFVVSRPTPFPFEKWGFDNQAFVAWRNGTPWDESAYMQRLVTACNVAQDPYLAVCPDIVAGGLRSLDFSLEWRTGRLRDIDFPWYLAVQDGMSVADVRPHLHLFAGIFLGGSDRFKAQAHRWATLAHSCLKQFHYGRASTPGKLVSAFRAGADSVDSSFPLWTAERFQTFSRRWEGLNEQTCMVL
jgi:hypothetical protein